MSDRRLKRVIRCATCATSFRPRHKEQLTCSPICGAIRRVRLYPQHHRMLEANRANRQREADRLAEKLQGMTLLQAYRYGNLRGYRTGYQKGRREERRAAA